jgi:hypothetical protein
MVAGSLTARQHCDFRKCLAVATGSTRSCSHPSHCQALESIRETMHTAGIRSVEPKIPGSGVIYKTESSTRLRCESSSSRVQSMTTTAFHCPRLTLVNNVPPGTLSFFLAVVEEPCRPRPHFVSSEFPGCSHPQARLVAILADRQHPDSAIGCAYWLTRTADCTPVFQPSPGSGSSGNPRCLL